MISLHDTGPRRAATRFMRGVYFFFGSIFLPMGVVMLPSSVGVGIMLVVLASLMLLLWWAFHRPLAVARARPWQRAGMVLSTAIAVGLMTGLIASIQDDSEVPLPPFTIGCAAASVALLAVRIVVGLRVRTLSSRPSPLQGAAAEHEAWREDYDRAVLQQERAELDELGRQLRRGAYKGKSTRVAADGSVIMRPRLSAECRHTAFSAPFRVQSGDFLRFAQALRGR